MREGRLESILHSELFIHQHNLQSFEERRDVQAFPPEMFALHGSELCSVCVRGHACVPAESAPSVNLQQAVKLSTQKRPTSHKITQTQVLFCLT